MKVLILGGSGMIGHMMWQVLSKTYPKTYVTLRKPFEHYERFNLFKLSHSLTNFEATHFDRVRSVLNVLGPDIILNCIGLTIRRKELENTESRKQTNAELPHVLDRWCRLENRKLIHFSTDCVFSGNTDIAYYDSAPPDAQDNYGSSKGLGEVSNSPNTLTLRSSMIGPELENFSELYEWFLQQRGKNIRGFDRVIYSGITTLQMANYVSHIISKKTMLTGLYNVSSEPISKYDLLMLIKKVMQLGDIQIERESSKISNKSLNSERFFRETQLPKPNWNDMLANLQNSNSFYEEVRSI